MVRGRVVLVWWNWFISFGPIGLAGIYIYILYIYILSLGILNTVIALRLARTRRFACKQKSHYPTPSTRR